MILRLMTEYWSSISFWVLRLGGRASPKFMGAFPKTNKTIKNQIVIFTFFYFILHHHIHIYVYMYMPIQRKLIQE